MVFDDFSTKEELLGMISLKGKTRGLDIFTEFKAYICQIKLCLYKLVSMTTDGAPAMTGIHNGFIALCHKDEDFPDFISYHCIIHQQVLASKRLNTKHVMDISFKIVNSIKGKSLQRRLFKQQLGEKEPELAMHTDVRWLSRGKFLQRFRDLLDEIIKFLDERGDDYQQLRDLDWQCDLAFLADFTGKLSTLNLSLQGKNKTLTEMISSIAAFQCQTESMIVDIEKKKFEQFVNIKDHMEKHPTYNFISKKYTSEIKAVVADFEVRFGDFRKIENLVQFISYPVRVWAEFCYPGENLSEEKLKGLYKSHKLICSRHFDRSAYTDQTMNRLTMNAVPTLENLHIFGSSQQSIEVTEYWADKKCTLKKTCAQHAQSMRRTGGGVADDLPTLSPLDQRLIAIMGGVHFVSGDSYLATFIYIYIY
ncbi:hypothetical protein ACJJTC_006936 [Scirpophaga incertulas]